MASPSKLAVLVTGSAGAIGRSVCRELVERGHRVRAVDRLPTPGVSDSTIADLTDGGTARRLCEGIDVVIHLAAQAEPFADFLTDLLPNNITATYNLFEAARLAGVKRVVFASSMHVGHNTPPGEIVRAEHAPAPGNFYGVTKVFGEALGQMYARTHGLSVISARIAFLPRSPMHVARLIDGKGYDWYISPRDSGRFFALCTEARLSEQNRYVVLFAAGPGGETCMDMQTARDLIGYEPRDPWPVGMDEVVPGWDKAR
ncbi:MAG: NAD(P)-dependent oxidoreductase [Planctomycetes bacterium]|nr:NAD(P)-dependent oxidoreductase [Planctomycetota bacterium]